MEANPRLIAIWQTAPTSIAFESEKEAAAARHRLYVARKHLAAIDPILYAKVRYYAIRIKGHILEVFDPNISLDRALSAAGIALPAAPEPPPLDTFEPPELD